VGNIHKPTVKVTHNDKVNRDTFRIGKAGVRNHFLLFSPKEAEELYELLGAAIRGHHESDE